MFDRLPHGFSSPTAETKIFKDECPFSFESVEHEGGLYICMKHCIGVGPSTLQKYSSVTHSDLFLHFSIQKEFLVKDSISEPPTKLALGVPGGFELSQDQYTVTEHWALVQVSTGHRMDLPNPVDGQASLVAHLASLSLPEILKIAIAKIQLAKSAVLTEELASGVSAWASEDDRPVSRFAETLKQLKNGVRVLPSGWKCSSCDLRDNLWLNLTDGSINCGRRFWDGTGGNNHAIDHYNKTKYPLAVKLGTVSAEGADIFSYEEDCMVTDPKLAEHLAHFGIDIMRMHKTDKSMLEIEVAANERLGEWITLQESDHVLQPRFGPGLTGLRNLGNSCYMNTVIQVLFAISDFRRFYAYRLPNWIDASLSAMNKSDPSSDRGSNSGPLPVDDVGLQFAKLGYGLCSGLYSVAPTDSSKETKQSKVVAVPSGIRPLLFRRLLGRNHAAFSTKQQQDAFECFIHILDMLDATVPGPVANDDVRPRDWMRLSVEDRIECGLTQKVRYIKHDEMVLSLSIPIEAMINGPEYEAYRLKEKQAKESGVTVPEEDVVRPRIPLTACLSTWAARERIDGFKSPASSPPGALTHAFRTSRLLNFPDYLCIQVCKYTVGEDWLPHKLDVEIELDHTDGSVDDDGCGNFVLDLSALRSSGGPLSGEELMPEDTPISANEPASVVANAVFMEQLLSMGFSTAACERACIATHNIGLEEAIIWLTEHMDDPNLNLPLKEEVRQPASHVGDGVNAVDLSTIELLTSMGFSRNQVENALRRTRLTGEAAVQWFMDNQHLCSEPVESEQNGAVAVEVEPKLTDGGPRYKLFAFISHMGTSTSVGHYVAHIRRSALCAQWPAEDTTQAISTADRTGQDKSEWIIFNDEKVAKSDHPPHRHAYLYFFRRL